MSDFVTNIPVDIESTRKLLPPGSEIDPNLRWNSESQQLQLTWRHKNLLTPYTFPLEYPVELLKAKEFPKKASVREIKNVVEPITDNDKVSVDSKPRGRVKKGLT